MKRRLAVFIAFIAGFYWFFTFFWHEFDLTGVGIPFREDLSHYQGLQYRIWLAIGAGAIGLGLVNIIRVHGKNVLRLRKGWYNSLALFIAMILMMVFGFWSHYGNPKADLIFDAGHLGEAMRDKLAAEGTDVTLSDVTREAYAAKMPRLRLMENSFEHFSSPRRRESNPMLAWQWARTKVVVNELYETRGKLDGLLKLDFTGANGGQVTFPIDLGDGDSGWSEESVEAFELKVLSMPGGLESLYADMQELTDRYQERKEEVPSVSWRRRKAIESQSKLSRKTLGPLQGQFYRSVLLTDLARAFRTAHLDPLNDRLGISDAQHRKKLTKTTAESVEKVHRKLTALLTQIDQIQKLSEENKASRDEALQALKTPLPEPPARPEADPAAPSQDDFEQQCLATLKKIRTLVQALEVGDVVANQLKAHLLGDPSDNENPGLLATIEERVQSKNDAALATTAEDLLPADAMKAGAGVLKELQSVYGEMEALNQKVANLDAANRRNINAMNRLLDRLIDTKVEKIVRELRRDLLLTHETGNADTAYDELFEYFRDNHAELAFSGGWVPFRSDLRVLFKTRIPHLKTLQASGTVEAGALARKIVAELDALPGKVRRKALADLRRDIGRLSALPTPAEEEVTGKVKELAEEMAKAKNLRMPGKQDRLALRIEGFGLSYSQKIDALIKTLDEVAQAGGESVTEIEAVRKDLTETKALLLRAAIETAVAVRKSPLKEVSEEVRRKGLEKKRAEATSGILKGVSKTRARLAKALKGTTPEESEERRANALAGVEGVLKKLGELEKVGYKNDLTERLGTQADAVEQLLEQLLEQYEEAVEAAAEGVVLEDKATLQKAIQMLQEKVYNKESGLLGRALVAGKAMPESDAAIAAARLARTKALLAAIDAGLVGLRGTLHPTSGQDLARNQAADAKKVAALLGSLDAAVGQLQGTYAATTIEGWVGEMKALVPDFAAVEKSKDELRTYAEENLKRSNDLQDAAVMAISVKAAFDKKYSVRYSKPEPSPGTALTVTFHYTKDGKSLTQSFDGRISTGMAVSPVRILAKDLVEAGVELSSVTALTISSPRPLTLYLGDAKMVKKGTLFAVKKIWDYVLFFGLLNALGATMFSLLAFYIVSASYRAFRVRSIEAAVLMLVAFIIMLGQIPLGSEIWSEIGGVRQWLLLYVNGAAQRAIAFGVGLASFAMSLRIWLGIERGLY